MDEVGIREWCGNLVCEVSRFRMSACVVGCGAGLVDLRWEAGEKKKEEVIFRMRLNLEASYDWKK